MTMYAEQWPKCAVCGVTQPAADLQQFGDRWACKDAHRCARWSHPEPPVLPAPTTTLPNGSERCGTVNTKGRGCIRWPGHEGEHRHG